MPHLLPPRLWAFSEPIGRDRAVFRRINEEGESGVIQYGYKFVPVK